MSLSDIANVTITRVSSAVTQQGFSTPCILAYQTRRTTDRVHSYASLAEMTTAGYTPDDTAHKIASALWSQPNPPAAIKIGRRSNAFTKSIRLTPSEANSTVYSVECEGLEASYTTDSSASVAEICTNLTTAINALGDVDAILATGGASSTSLQTLSGASLNGVLGYRALSPSRRITLVLSNHADWDASTATITGKDANGATITDTLSIPNGGNATLTTTKLFARVTSVAIPVQSGTGGTFTVGVAAPWVATDGTTHIDLAAPVGIIPSLEVIAGDLTLEDRTSDPGLASDLTAIRAEDDDWYCALLDSNSSAEILALAAIIEPLTPKKILVAQSADIAVLDPDSITDVAYLTADRDYFRTHVSFHPGIATADSWIAAALVGNALAYDPGSVTWVNRELVGVSSWGPTSADRTALLAKNCGSIETVAGRKVTFGGKVGGGEWLDIIHGLDWLHARIGERIFGLLASAADAKIGFTDKGIARVHAELRAQLTEASAAPSNLLATWSTTVPTAASLSSSQRATRVLPNVTFIATVQGAIHAVNVAGTVAA